jgi:hypothetical protein
MLPYFGFPFLMIPRKILWIWFPVMSVWFGLQ